jgi:hypothetical protein
MLSNGHVRAHGPIGWALALIAASLLVGAPPAAAKVVRLTSDPSASHPDIAVDESGTAHVAWGERAAGQPSVLVYCRVQRDARGCSRLQRFALPGAQTSSGDDHRVVISPAGEVILVARRLAYTGGGTYVLTSGDGGTSFAAPRKISDLGGDADWDARFGPGDFSVSLAQAGCPPGARYRAAPLDATTEGAAALTPFTGGGCGITAPWLGSPSIAFVDPLTPLVAFRVSATPDAHSESEIYFRRWNGAGSYNDAANWAPARLVARGDGTRLASGPRGIYLMYHDPRAQGTAQTSNYWVRRYDPAANAFGSPTRVSRSIRGPLNDIGGDVMQDAGGNVHAVFAGRDPGSPKEVRHRVSRDGVSWDPIRVLATHGPRLAFSGELRVGAARDGGGAVVARGSGPSAAANGIYLLTFGPIGQGGDGECPPSVTVGVVVVRALEGCLRRDGARYTTGAAVKVNGVDVEPRRRETEVYRLTVDTKERTLETRGEANVRVGGVVLDRRAIAWKLPQAEGRLQRLGVPDGSVFPDLARFARTLFSFPVKGDAELRVAKGATALIDTSFQMPALLGGVTGDVTLRTTDQQGLVLDGFKIKVPEARIGKLRIAAVEVVYESDPDVFKGSAEIQLPPAYGPPLSVAFGFREGRLNLVHADKRFDPTLPIVGVPPEPVVGLDLLGFDYLHEAGSRTFQGLVELQGGPKVRGLFRVSELDGKVTLTFPPEPQPASIDATGELKIVGIPFATGHVRYSTDNLFSFDGTFQFPPPGKWEEVAKVSASVAGFLALSEPFPFSAAGDATATIAGVPVSGEAVISTKGVSGCIPLPDPLPDVGVSYRWEDDYPTLTCNVGDFKLPVPGTARAAQAGRAVWVPGGLRQAAIAIVGQGSAPTVRVTAPSGEQVTTGPGPRVVGRFITQQFDEAATTYVSIGQPPAGGYTIEPEPGSPPIERVSLARGLPDPSVSATVRGTGRTRTLRYRIRTIAGQRVTFAEQSAGGLYRELSTTRKARGRISFHPKNSSQRRRRIVALVEQNGYPRAKLQLARFTAPKPRPLARPRRVQIRRKGAKLIVRWSKVKRARGYELRIILPRDGRRLLRTTKPGRRKLTIGGLERNDTGTVTVRAIDDDASPGKPRTARLRAKPRNRSVHK